MDERTDGNILPYEGRSPYLFVSYDPADRPEIVGLLEKMRDRGLRLWLSDKTPDGPERDDIIARRLEGCGCFVAFLSNRYLANRDVMDELNYSRDLEKQQLLLFMRPTDMSAGILMRMSRSLSLKREDYPSEQALFADMMKTEGFGRFYGVDSPELDAKIVKKLGRLEQLYPDHRVFALRGIDQTLAEDLIRLCGESEYDTLEDLLQAYGYTRITGEEAKRLRGSVVCAPGSEPEAIRPTVENAFRTLAEYYPGKQIPENLQRSHKALFTRLHALHQWLGYEDMGAFLQAYGFRYFYSGTDGRPGRGEEVYRQMLAELREKYRDREKPASVGELRTENPELAPVLKTLTNNSRDLFGTTIKEALVREGILRPAEEKAVYSPTLLALDALRAFYASGQHGSYEEASDRLSGVVLRRRPGNRIVIHRAEDCDEDLQIPYGIAGIRGAAFADSSVRRVALPEGCTELAARAFAGCETLEEIVLPEGLQVLEAELFDGCTALKSVVLPSSLKTIRSRAFYGCTALERIAVPAATEIIEAGAFEGCVRLAEVTLSNPKISIFEGAFEGCPFSLPEQDHGGVTFTYTADKKNRAVITGFSGHTAQIEVPDTLMGHPVTGIDKNVFTAHTELREIVLPDSVTDLKGDAFRDCTNLERLRLSNGISKITSAAFAGCVNLREVNIPEALDEVKRGLFKDSPVEVLHVGRNTSRVDPNAFYHREYDAASGTMLVGKAMRRILIDPENPHLRADGTLLFSPDGTVLLADLGDAEECIVPEGVEEIREDAFSKNQFLRSVTLPSTLRSIGPGAFAETGLEEVRFPASLRFIGEKAFSFCRKLRKAALPEGLETLGDQAFEGCPVEEIRIPASLQSLGSNCYAILSLYQGEVRQSFEVAAGNDLYHADGLVLYRTDGEERIALKAYGYGLRSPLGAPQTADVRYVLESGTTAIADQAFYRCDRLCEAVLPNTLRSIGLRAFMDCPSLTLSGLGPGVEIGALAFAGTPLQA